MIKRIVCAVIVIALLAPTAFADEITFRGIPWGASVADVEAAMEKDGIRFYTYNERQMRRWEGLEQAFDFDHLYDEPCGWYAYAMPNGFEVAGYPVASIGVSCVWGYSASGEIQKEKEDSNFYIAVYAFDVIDKEAAYKDLQEKLSSLYGTYTEKSKSGTYFHIDSDGSGGECGYREWISEWDGDDNTAVKLYCYSADREGDSSECVSIYYGKTDMDEYIDALQEIIKEDLIRQEQARRNSSVDGL